MMKQTIIAFNRWMAENASWLMAYLGKDASFDEDAFQDSYLSLVTSYSGVSDSNAFMTAFVETYLKMKRRALRESLNTIRPDDLFFSLLQSPEDTETAELRRKENRFCLAEAIAEHISATYGAYEVAIWKMHMGKHSIRDIADAIGESRTLVNQTLHRIKSNTIRQFAYAI